MVGTVNTFQVGNMHQQPASAAAPLRHQPAPLMLDGGTGVDSGSSCPTLKDARLFRARMHGRLQHAPGVGRSLNSKGQLQLG